MAKKDSAVLAEPEVLTEGFYWMGLLPAPGEVVVELPKRDPPYIEEHKTTAYDCWMTGGGYGKDLRVFIAKFRQQNGLTVRGWHFHATCQAVEHRGAETSRVDFPGHVAWMVAASDVQKIIDATRKTFIRFKHGADKYANSHNPVEVWDKDFGHKPDGMSDAEWMRYAQNGQLKAPVFNPRTDIWATEFVYVVKLDYDRSRIDEAEYAKNPNKYHAGMVPGMTREFFDNPPKSVADMYPQA